MDLKQHIRSIPDFPKPGILFYDISSLLAHPQAWRATVERLAEAVHPYRPDLLVGIESRGFLVAAPLAFALGSGFAMVRKKGKLPGKTVRYSYDLEYGTDTIEMQEDAISPGQRIVIVDDLLATGGNDAGRGRADPPARRAARGRGLHHRARVSQRAAQGRGAGHLDGKLRFLTPSPLELSANSPTHRVSEICASVNRYRSN